uniref:PPM-type phosphatase domain-containing protein n=1 Tax=Compsopogon caeruleus TaxID=31354 RepID=A0A7S1XCS4_9RHOD|mmetsp:Transcript_15409/g.31217  ORF Transcript_15409/g.31217 Transcript_15409/m.31217 type:complete len:352 (+) Transcript_15409:72-1127(+)|eukprot:CAMPEP_0184687978 /NCGR_PEP_ID=MMETSP0312-20130426/28128_1 /TAXON_ID=31354 /ORGANISM="Compsopogon coeruleus, Strain SAG 36.94" /LENGTH=351 /DNA_ID=CAMNT_0027144633 /DNA_START=51 /DNA_END=1106 /DNA_ORIENTATION=+
MGVRSVVVGTGKETADQTTKPELSMSHGRASIAKRRRSPAPLSLQLESSSYSRLSTDDSVDVYDWLEGATGAYMEEKDFVEKAALFASISRRGRQRFCSEDRFFSVEYLGVFGVFDGMAGGRAAQVASQAFPEYFFNWNQAKHEGDGAVSSNIDQALRESFAHVEEYFVQSASSSEDLTSGTTAVVVVLSDSRIGVGSVGDSRAVLCRTSGPVVQLTTVHDTSSRVEVEAVEKAGGLMIHGRVNGVLSVTRAIGKCDLKPALSAIPDVSMYEILPIDRFLVLATDGLWNFVDTDTFSAAMNRSRDPGEAVEALVNLAAEGGSTDDITITVVDLHKFLETGLSGTVKAHRNS